MSKPSKELVEQARMKFNSPTLPVEAIASFTQERVDAALEEAADTMDDLALEPGLGDRIRALKSKP